MGEWINAAEAAQRLGVKQATLYAYVSRGMLARRRGEDGRSSLFEADEVARLADRGQRGEPRRAAGTGDFVIESEPGSPRRARAPSRPAAIGGRHPGMTTPHRELQ